jgi:hypothetical protein
MLVHSPVVRLAVYYVLLVHAEAAHRIQLDIVLDNSLLDNSLLDNSLSDMGLYS